MKRLRTKEGFARRDVMRTAGSHGVFDVIAIDPVRRIIKLIQSKSGKSKEREIAKLADLERYSGTYTVVSRAE